MTAGCGTILSVEDSDTDFVALQFALKAAGIKNRVERCANGKLAMDMLSLDSCPLSEKASLVLLDLNLPGVDGRQVLKAMRARDPKREVPVIVLSTSSHQRDIDDCFRAGADAYTVKPLELDDWETEVASLAERWLQAAQGAAEPTKKDGSQRASAIGASAAPRGRRRKSSLNIEQLTRTIENEIIPRLLLAHAVPEVAKAAVPEVPGRLASFEDKVAELAGLVLEKDVGVAASYVEMMRERGDTLESVFHALVAPAARLVGDLWKANVCNSAQFTEALERLQQLLVELDPNCENETRH
jgi:two-component system, response regulator